jgi:hypothetical protein
LLRISLFQIAYIRNLFPSSFFSERTIFDDLNVKILNPKCEVSKRLVDWMEIGVCEALYKEYLKCLRFGITSNDQGNELIEEYVFTFAYQPDGEIRMQILNSIKKSPVNALNDSTVMQLKGQVSKMTRLLIALMASFDPIPGEKNIALHLEYYERTPKSYEPPFFEAAPNLPKFECKPFSMGLGACQTRDICIGMKAKTTAVSDLDQEISPSGNNIRKTADARREEAQVELSPAPEEELISFATVFDHTEFTKSQPEEAMHHIEEMISEQDQAAEWTKAKMKTSGSFDDTATDFQSLSLRQIHSEWTNGESGSGSRGQDDHAKPYRGASKSQNARKMQQQQSKKEPDPAEAQDPESDLAWDVIPASQPDYLSRKKKLSRGILSANGRAGPVKRIRMQEVD